MVRAAQSAARGRAASSERGLCPRRVAVYCPYIRTNPAGTSMLDAVLRQAQRDFDAHLERLQRYIRQPSVSAENRGIDETAAMIAAEIGELGGVGRVVPAKEFPIVYGRFDVGAPRTVVVHSMYDTTPADEPNWSLPPFEGRRVAQLE